MGARSKRFKLVSVSVVVCAVLILLIFLFWRDSDDVIHHGIPLSEHLIIVHSSFVQGAQCTPEQVKASKQALHELGSRCVPLLQGWLQEETPQWQIELYRFTKRFGINIRFLPPADRRTIACRAILVGRLGEGLSPLFPILARATTNSNGSFAFEAAMALDKVSWDQKVPPDEVEKYQEIFRKSLVHLENLAKNGLGDAQVKSRQQSLKHAIRACDPFGYYADGSYALLQDMKSSPLEGQIKPLRILSRRKRFPEEVEPFLLAHLRSTNLAAIQGAARSAGNYGIAAEYALPDLEKLAQHEDPSIQSTASNAIGRIRTLLRDAEAASP